MTEIQNRLFDMLVWFDSFCRKNNLRYYALGGTLLGAARHKGFIPWDDDIDIGVPRSDYDKLLSIMNNMKCQYVLESPYSTDNNYCYPYSKIYDTKSTLIENSNGGLVRGIFLDIFPIDGIGNTRKEALDNFRLIKSKNLLYLTRVCEVRKGRKWYKNMATFCMKCIPQFIINNVKMRMKIDILCKQIDFDNSKFVGNLLGNAFEREIVPRAYFGIPTELKFEGLVIYVPQLYDKYLSTIYGDWKKLPPKENRVSIHDFKYIDLHKSYLSMNNNRSEK